MAFFAFSCGKILAQYKNIRQRKYIQSKERESRLYSTGVTGAGTKTFKFELMEILNFVSLIFSTKVIDTLATNVVMQLHRQETSSATKSPSIEHIHVSCQQY